MEEVKRYGEVFWKMGPKVFTPDVWRRIRSRVEMREKKIAEVKDMGANGFYKKNVAFCVICSLKLAP